MDGWLSRASTGLFERTTARRGMLGWLGRASAGVVAGSMTLAGATPAMASSCNQTRRPDVPVGSIPLLLPRGQKAVLPLSCGSCSGEAEYVCSYCCEGGTCCPDGDLYRQPC